MRRSTCVCFAMNCGGADCRRWRWKAGPGIGPRTCGGLTWGGSLSEDSATLLTPGEYDVVFVIADGLSALAVERHALRLLREVLPFAGWRLAPVCVVEQGRVAVGDAIGEALHASLTVMLIGERPG